MVTGLPARPGRQPAMRLPGALDTPALVVDSAALDQNIRRMAEMLDGRGVALRPHVKTHKSVEIARRQCEAGAAGLTVATLGEAEVFVAAGFRDLFIAYPLWASPAKAARLRRVAERARLRLAADSPAGARLLGQALGPAASAAELLVEVDSGNRRSGVAGPAAAVEVAAAASAAGLAVAGVFTHGGHSYASPAAAGNAADDEVTALAAAATALREAGYDPRVASAGSTPTALLSARDGVTEERPGTYVFGDRLQLHLGTCVPGDIALVVAATAVSRPPGRAVLDVGAKTLSSDCPPLLNGYGLLPHYPEAVITRVYDHHGILESPGRLPRLGETVAVIPNHVCPVVNLAEEFTVCEDGQVVGHWPVDARLRSR